jgi:hypothetical protein
MCGQEAAPDLCVECIVGREPAVRPGLAPEGQEVGRVGFAHALLQDGVVGGCLTA